MADAIAYYKAHDYSWEKTRKEMKRLEKKGKDVSGWFDFLSNKDGVLGVVTLESILK